MTLKLYYVTNRRHEGQEQWAPKGYGTDPSKSGIENLRLGKVTLDVKTEILEKQFKDKTGSGPGNGVELSDDLTKLAEKHAKIQAFYESPSEENRKEEKPEDKKIGSHEMRDEVFKAIKAKQR